jgi:hypothetical protein
MAKYDDVLDRPVMALSQLDSVRVRDLLPGTFICGSSNSGKTSTSGKQLGHGLLCVPHMGGLILTAKAEETRNWIEYAKTPRAATASTLCITNGIAPVAERAILKPSSICFPHCSR